MAKKLANNKISMDSVSDESLSFVGFLSIQDLQEKSQPKARTCQVITKQDQEFEFSCTTPDSCVRYSNKNLDPQLTTAATNKQAHLQALPPQANVKALNRSQCKNLISTNNDSKGSNKNSDKAIMENKKNRSASGFHKMVRSYVSPCKNCRAQEPASVVKSNAMVRQTTKAQ